MMLLAMQLALDKEYDFAGTLGASADWHSLNADPPLNRHTQPYSPVYPRPLAALRLPSPLSLF